jgi:hypothetical protein
MTTYEISYKGFNTDVEQFDANLKQHTLLK